MRVPGAAYSGTGDHGNSDEQHATIPRQRKRPHEHARGGLLSSHYFNPLIDICYFIFLTLLYLLLPTLLLSYYSSYSFLLLFLHLLLLLLIFSIPLLLSILPHV